MVVVVLMAAAAATTTATSTTTTTTAVVVMLIMIIGMVAILCWLLVKSYEMKPPVGDVESSTIGSK